MASLDAAEAALHCRRVRKPSMMLNLLIPDLWVESIAQLSPEKLRAMGLSGVLLDVDNTVKDHGAPCVAPEASARIRSWMDFGVAVCLLSNGRSERIGKLARMLDVPFVSNALKPSPRSCHRAAKLLGLEPRALAVVGDQVFADVLAGRLAGMYTILVTPTCRREPWFTRAKRPIESLVLSHPRARARREHAVDLMGPFDLGRPRNGHAERPCVR
jgi:HAD superfamily phosphatase (TIGR01668 family)